MAPCHSSRLPIDFSRRLELRFGDLEAGAGAFHGAEEARLVAFVARRTGLLDLDEKRVPVAIERNILDDLDVAALLSLHPEFFPGTAPEVGLARGECRFERGPIQPSHHQHPSRRLFLNDRGNEAVLSPLQPVIKAHTQGPQFVTAGRWTGRGM